MTRRFGLLAGLIALLALAGCTVPRLIRQGDELLSAKKPAEAAAKYREALGRSPKLANHPDFAAKLRRAQALAHYDAAYQLAERKSWDEAVARFSDSLAADPALPEAQQALAWAKREAAKAHHQRALGLADTGDLNAAIDALQRAHQLDPENLDVKDALDSLKDKKAKNLSNASSLYHRALTLAADKLWGQAADGLAKAVAANPNHILARVARAKAQAQLDAARKLLDQARQNLADRRLERAIAAANDAIAIWPNCTDAKQVLAAATARRQQARDLARRAVALGGNAQWDDAAATAAQALELYPYDTETQRFLTAARATAAAKHVAEGRKLLKQGQLEAAERAFLRALDHVPAHRDARAGLADADLARGAEAERTGLWGAAFLWYTQAAAHLPEPPYATKLAQADARVLARVRFALAAQITGRGGRDDPAAAALRSATMDQLARRRPDVLLIGPGAPPLYGLAAQLASLQIHDRITNQEQRVHHYTIARDVPNPDVPRLQQILRGARFDLAHLRREAHRRCPVCRGARRVPCPTCRGTKSVPCARCKATGVYKGKPCKTCHGTGRHRCPVCKGRGTVECRHCRGTGNPARVSRHDLERKEREVRDYEWDLRRAPAYITREFPAEWPYSVRRHERKGVIDILLTLRNLAAGTDIATQRLQRNVPYYDSELVGANPDIGLSPDPLTLPDHGRIAAQLTAAAAEAIATQAIAVALKARVADARAHAAALARQGNAAHTLEARIDLYRLLRAHDPAAAAALLRQLSAAPPPPRPPAAPE